VEEGGASLDIRDKYCKRAIDNVKRNLQYARNNEFPDDDYVNQVRESSSILRNECVENTSVCVGIMTRAFSAECYELLHKTYSLNLYTQNNVCRRVSYSYTHY